MNPFRNGAAIGVLCCVIALAGCVPPQGACVAYTQEGANLLSEGNVRYAIWMFNEALAADSSYAEAWYLRAYAYLWSGDSVAAMRDVSRAISLDPIHSGAYYLRAMLSCDRGDYDRAMSDARQLLTLYPAYADGFSCRGVVFEAMGRDDSALANYNIAIALRPQTNDLIRRAWVLFRAGDNRGSIADFSRTLELLPGTPDIYSDRALVRYTINDFAGAISDCDSALAIDPEHAGAAFNKGIACEKLGWKREAREAYRLFLQVAPPGDPDIQEAEARLRELRR